MLPSLTKHFGHASAKRPLTQQQAKRVSQIEKLINNQLREARADRREQDGLLWRLNLPQQHPLKGWKGYKLSPEDSFLETSEDRELSIFFADYDEGLAEIRENFLPRDKEHAWVYLPKSEAWIDVTLCADEQNVASNKLVASALAESEPGLTRVHSHPDATIEKLHKQRLGDSCHLQGPLPSSHDLISEANGPEGSKSAVVSRLGVCTYIVTDAAREAGFMSVNDLRVEQTDLNNQNPTEFIQAQCKRLEAKNKAGIDEKEEAFKIDFSAFQNVQ